MRRRWFSCRSNSSYELALHDGMVEANVSDSEMADRIGVGEKAARRLRDLLQRNAIDGVEAALRCLGKLAAVSVMDAA
jgi:hypothetical protein